MPVTGRKFPFSYCTRSFCPQQALSTSLKFEALGHCGIATLSRYVQVLGSLGVREFPCDLPAGFVNCGGRL